jgi:hypothetical protein
MANAVKVHFQLVQDEDGYPPVTVESVWAQSTPRPCEYLLDNVPFFARTATIGDVVGVREDDGQLWFESVVRRSPNSLIRIVFFDRSGLERVNQRLIGYGCATEYLSAHNVLAVSIPDNVSLREVQAYLQGEATAGVLDYEEPILRQ